MIIFYKYMVDKYEVLVEMSTTPEMKKFRLECLFGYQQKLIELQN